MKTKKILLILLSFAVLCSGIILVSRGFISRGFAETNKEYRKGEIIYIGGKDYLIASNKQFIEILEIAPDDKLFQVSEVHGMERINDLCISHERGRHYLIVATGRYLIKYDITNPVLPKIVIKRDLYKFRKGKYKIGYMSSLASNDNYLFAAGSRGVRRFIKENLFVDKIYTFEKSYGIAADNDKLVVLTKDKGLIFDISTGDIEGEYKLENIKNNKRKPAIDYTGNIYLPSDNSFIKINNGIIGQYYNSVKAGVIHSYAVDVLPSGEIFYVNGYGVTKLNNSLAKEKFLYSAKNKIYGPNSWASGIDVKGIKQGKRVTVFNKSSILLLDDNLNLLFQYRYTPLYTDDITVSTDLKITLSQYCGVPLHDTVSVEIYGYWPNEEVEITFGSNKHLVKVNNLGYGEVKMTVPEMDKGITIISAKGQDSGLSYQTTFNIN